ncbi:hypothetical protein ABXT08_20885 [Chryseobacterium sp. NRRL B-14859]|uniref:hypothetical protein n=1 Tax=Chryseobacterium sp. NRRL B-14859 TaxID=1562763 RepID=UPI003396D2AF
MADIDRQEFSVNSKSEKKNLIKISENSNYTVYYILDRKDFDLKKGLGTNRIANIIFFSKKYSKGILVNFEQMIYYVKKNIYKISLHTDSHNKYMFIPSMIIVDNDFNYEYLMKYYYMPLPPPKGDIYTSSIAIQDIKNYCNGMETEIKGNIINENIDDILSNISKISKKNSSEKKCNPIIYDIDLKDFFPNKIIR